MESIDRLRRYVKEHASCEWAYATAPPKYPLVNCADVDLLDIADAIELEVKASRVDAYTEGYDAGFASADDWAAQHEDAMAEHGWVRLPLDADGEPIHAGDVLDGYGKTIEVVELRHGRSGWVLISRDGNGYADTFAFTHHHAPTVEDVLREFAYGLGVPVADSYVAATAAKLRLAEGSE